MAPMDANISFEGWVEIVDRLMERDWCISSRDAGLSDADLRCLWRDGETPAEFVKWFAEKHDLIRFERSPYGIRSALP